MFSQMFLIILTKNVAKMFFIKQFNKKNVLQHFLIILIENVAKMFFINNLIKKHFCKCF
jgi:hypothetical protein